MPRVLFDKDDKKALSTEPQLILDSMEYDTEFFIKPDIQAAKEVILVEISNSSTDERWEKETKWLMNHIKFNDDKGLILDYGCGIGRLSKEIKNPVLGVDISSTMRIQAESYVDRPGFSVIRPEMLPTLSNSGLRFDGAISIWALQHVLDINHTVEIIMGMMNANGILWSLDQDRQIPVKSKYVETWMLYEDGIDITDILKKWCSLEEEILTPYRFLNPNIKLRKYRKL